jgi:hypothetical protein
MVRWTRTRWSLTSRHLLALCVATSIAEICILNIQPIVGIATVGLYIVVGFTRPLLSALIVAFVFLRFSYNPQYRQIFRALIVFFIVAAGYRMRHVSAISRPEADQLTPLVSFVKAQISQDSVIAMITYHRPFQSSTKEWEWRWQPNVVAALTRTHLLKEALGLEWGALSPEETISRELALGVIFTGEPKLIRGCAEDLILSPKRLFFLQWIPIQLTRKFNCEQSRDIIRDMSPCEAFQLFAVDYVIWEREFQLLKPAYLEHAGELVWTSPNNDIEVIKIDSEKAANYLCTTKPHV